MRAKSINAVNSDDLRTKMSEIVTSEFKPTLGFTFISIKQDFKEFQKVFNDFDIDLMGVNSAGEFTDHHHSDGESAILLLELPRTAYSIICKESKGQALAEIAADVAHQIKEQFDCSSIILCSTCLNDLGQMFEGSAFIKALDRTMNGQSDIFGGMAGADGQLIPSSVLSNNFETKEGFVLLAVDNDKIETTGMAVSGWKPLGNIREVTKTKDGWLCEIDGQPALEMYLRYLGESPDQGKDNFVDSISIFYPFLSIDQDDPEIRTPMFIDREKNALMLDFPLPARAKFQFTMPPDFDIVEIVLDKAKERKKSFKADADALLIFSCYGRLQALGPLTIDENEGLHDIWNAPMAGFYTYSEYGRASDGKNKSFSTTCSWVALKEKN